MKIAFEINHPGQVHLLKNVYHNLIRKHSIIVFAKNEHSIIQLLSIYNIPFIKIGKKGKGIYHKLFMQIIFDLKVLFYVLFRGVKMGVGSSMTFDHVSIFTKLNSIHLSDDDLDVVPLIAKYSYPFSDVILSPDALHFSKYVEKNIRYAGIHELAYLHPNKFAPDQSVLEEAELKENEPFFVLRFVALKGHHDAGHRGINLSQKRKLIELLETYGRVLITSEQHIEPEFNHLKITLSPEKIHSLLYYATMFIGDSQTMTTEASVLGTPALKCNSFAGKLSVPNELETKYGLCFSYTPDHFENMLAKIGELLKKSGLKQIWKEKKDAFLVDKIDVSEFISWFVENYPESKKIMKENSDYQYNFK